MPKHTIEEPFWSLATDEALRLLRTRRSGLREAEVIERRTVFGPNNVPERQTFSLLKILGHQLQSPLILILLVAGATTAVLGETIETSVIFAAVAVNTALGFWQEHKAETVLELLKSYVKTRSRVRRSEREHEIDSSELVPGDIIQVTQGDRVSADARLLFVNNLEVDEAPLTGESLPVEKTTDALPAATLLADRRSMLFSGTLVVGGIGEAVVTATGDASEFGKIATLASTEEEPTPLQKSLSRFARSLLGILAVLILVLFLAGLSAGYGVLEMFLIGVAVAVSVVPEGLPIALTVILAIGVQRLALRRGIVRRLLAAETLGSTSLILTDKTGTLTQAKMELAAVVPVAGSTQELLSAALLHSSATIENPGDPVSQWNIVGRPIDVALMQAAVAEGLPTEKIVHPPEVVNRLPFSSKYKYSGVIVRVGEQYRLILLGAPEVLLGFVRASAREKEELTARIAAQAFMGEKVLGVASRYISSEDQNDILRNHTFSDLSFEGLISFRDPLRPGVSAAIQSIHSAGVKTIMVTGDHQGTAEAIARDLGLIDGKGAVLSGNDLPYLTAQELRGRADKVSVYARVTPEQKLLLTKLYQERGEIVAVTGDGVNDAPALRAADIG
ncbi:MAG: cation-transporting P-type ATPase, partial [Candidatus Sungbacteria bacterium]|nr:cation-transporting P-type ATPase [Candidatus Sungbacteria bacterium]